MVVFNAVAEGPGRTVTTGWNYTNGSTETADLVVFAISTWPTRPAVSVSISAATATASPPPITPTLCSGSARGRNDDEQSKTVQPSEKEPEMTYATWEAAEAARSNAIKTRPQIELMRELVVVLGHDAEAIGHAYARAEAAGLVTRRNNSHCWSAETYGRALYRNALRKGWL